MISAAANSLTPDFSGLTAEISKSVSHLKAKAAELHFNTPEAVQNNSFNDFPLNSYAVSYLEPQTSFTVQHLASEAGQGEKLNRQPQQKNVLNEDEKTSPDIEKAENPVSFWEELVEVADFSAFRYGMSVYEPKVATENDALFMISGLETVSGTYAAGAYDYVANINSRPQVLIDLMHEFNRSFDYTI